MKIPNAPDAIIELEKLTDYLLNLNHRRGASKARLLHSLGYSVENPERLAEDIRNQHVTADVIEHRKTEWGERFDVVAPLTGPIGDTFMFRSVWQIDLGSNHPRLITMYPE